MQSVWLLVVAAVVSVHLANVEADCKTPWEDCGSTDIKIDNVVVQNCCSSPCTVILGESTKFSFTFTPDKSYQDLSQRACGVIGDECIQFPNETFTDMCKCSSCKLSPPCPFQANTMYNMSVEVPLSSAFPEVTAIAKWQIFDSKVGATKPIGCFEVLVKTVRKSKYL